MTDPIKITEPGVYDVPEHVYHADKFLPAPSLSSSGARKLLNECPAKFWYERENPREPGTHLKIGKMAHQWLLEGDEAWRQHFTVLAPDHNSRTNAGKALVADIEANGRTAIKHDDFLMIEAMLKGLKEHHFAMAAFSDGVAEKTLIWTETVRLVDQATGEFTERTVWCRCRPDFFPQKHNIIADYKTTRSAEPDDLRRAMWDYAYHQQAEWYLRGIKALGLIENPRFLFIFQEKEPPYLITSVTPSDIAVEWAKIQNDKALEVFANCLATGEWPGYTHDILTMDLPVYAEHRLHEKKEQGAFELMQNVYAPHAAAE